MNPNQKVLEQQGILTNAQYYTPATISQITIDVKNTLEQKFNHVIVEGEISNYKKHISGHSYFSLIEGDSCLQAVAWKSISLPSLVDGMKVICTGKITAYTGRSQFQLIVQSLTLSGKGDLYKIFEELKKKLESEGLFADSRKKPLPRLPKIIAVITGANSDAEKDILKRMEERFLYKTEIFNVLVQGPNSPKEIKKAIEFFNNQTEKPDVIILSRGGGSIEDLSSFNDEVTVRAVANSQIPIITAVGHEMDVTLVDYVSDKRAPTPTASIEILLPKTLDLQDRIQQNIQKIHQIQQQQIKKYEEIIINSKKFSSNLLINYYELKNQKVDLLQDKMALMFTNHLALKKQQIPTLPDLAKIVELQETKLNHLRQIIIASPYIDQKQNQIQQLKQLLESFSYTKTLERGFTIAQTIDGQIIQSKQEAINAKEFTLQFHDGVIDIKVINKNNFYAIFRDMYSLFLFLYLLTTLILILVILFQKSPGIALQAKQNSFGPRARSNILTKLTGMLSCVFIGLCLFLTRTNIQNSKKTITVEAISKQDKK